MVAMAVKEMDRQMKPNENLKTGCFERHSDSDPDTRAFFLLFSCILLPFFFHLSCTLITFELINKLFSTTKNSNSDNSG